MRARQVRIEDLLTLFRNKRPEAVLDRVCHRSEVFRPYSLHTPFRNESARDEYVRLTEDSSERFSVEEKVERYSLLEQIQKSETYPKGYFGLLVQFADEHLVLTDGKLFSRIQALMEWNECSRTLTQDLFTIPYFVWKDRWKLPEEICRHSFDWMPILPVADQRLQDMINRGLAENHYHLYGSTESFMLSWVYFMNRPESIRKITSKYFQIGLSRHSSFGNIDNVSSWETRIKTAACIRSMLFEKAVQRAKSDLWNQFLFFHATEDMSWFKKLIAVQRDAYGCPLLESDGRRYILDYCIFPGHYSINHNSAYRFLSGERNFLYQCFLRCFNHEFDEHESELFYAYLLIKNNFRQELIQLNKGIGFENFRQYQDKKDRAYDGEAGYWQESLRLSVIGDTVENHVHKLECRITPKPSSARYLREFKELEKETREKGDAIMGYVVHFVKENIENIEAEEELCAYSRPRNWRTRKKIKVQARAISDYILKNDRGYRDIKGIDAANLEIHCRPEVFATEFRYLSHLQKHKGTSLNGQGKNSFQLRKTYHVGEDFLDIADGLRAVDEALLFLEMDDGCRLGHAMVLGVDPWDYYRLKGGRIVLRKQELLDDLVWILYGSNEMGVGIPSNGRFELERDALSLFEYIYDGTNATNMPDILRNCYEGWKLRGHHPNLFRCYPEASLSCHKYRYALQRYEHYMVQSDDHLCSLLGNQNAVKLTGYYHFNANVKRRGQEPEDFIVPDWYVEVMDELQRAMRRKCAEKGIVIECNPTSNYLIGVFKDYAKHPMFLFNNHHLDSSASEEPQLYITVNTDDKGVFDTSLSNEYALVLAAQRELRHSQGNYDDEAIYEYLEMIRRNGFTASFL